MNFIMLYNSLENLLLSKSGIIFEKRNNELHYIIGIHEHFINV